MRRLAIFLLLPITLLAMAACNEDNGSNGDDGDEPTVETTADATDEDSASKDDDGSGAAALFGAFNPLDVLSASSGSPSSGPGDPDLQAMLLNDSDMPAGFTSFGDLNYSLPTEYGQADMSMSMFAKGDLLGGEFDAMVASAAIRLPADALAELGDFSDLNDVRESDLDEIEAAAGAFGLTEVSLLEASGLGDGGAGIHMVMDFGELFGSFGAPAEENPFAGGMAMDMYMFGSGETMLMLIVMTPADGGGDVDGRSLAEAMDRKL